MAAPEPMIGRTFGRLRVLREAGRRKTGPDWLCLCDPALGGCGAEKVISGKLLRKQGGARSCGCLKRETVDAALSERAGDRIGKEYSGVVVLARLESSRRGERSGRASNWLCRCLQCGREFSLHGQQLDWRAANKSTRCARCSAT